MSIAHHSHKPMETLFSFPEPLLDMSRSMSKAMPAFELIWSAEARAVLSGRLQDQAYRQQVSNSFTLLADLVKNARTLEELKTNTSAIEKLLKQKYDSTLRAVFDQTQETRRALFSLQLAYQNAPEGKIRLLPIARDAFVDTADDAYWEAMKKRIRQLFLKYDLKNADAPCYLSFTFPINTPDAARKIAGFAEDVVAMAMLDIIRPFKGPKAVVEYMKNSFNIMNANGQLAHLMIAGTHGYKEGVYTDYDQTERLALPLGPALLGRMLATPVGTTPASLNGVGLAGINGVTIEYDGERADSSEFARYGLLSIVEQGKIQGTSTACNGDIPEYNSFPLMDIFLNVQRNLIAFANQVAHGNWGQDEQKAFADELLKYFNYLYDNSLRGYRVIEDPVTREMIGIFFNQDTKTVFVSIPIKYKGCVSRFRFTLKGKKDEPFDRVKARKI